MPRYLVASFTGDKWTAIVTPDCISAEYAARTFSEKDALKVRVVQANQTTLFERSTEPPPLTQVVESTVL